MFNDTKPHAGPAAKSHDIATAFAQRIAIHVDDPRHHSFKQVWESARDDASLSNAIRTQFKKAPNEDMMKGIIKSFLAGRYALGEIALYHADFYVDTLGRSVKSITDGILNSIAAINPRDAKLFGQMGPNQFLQVVDQARQSVLDKKAALLSCADVSDDEQNRLRHAYKRFHLTQVHRSRPLDYSCRLGDLYCKVNHIVHDPHTTLSFVKTNFDLLIQPPQNQLINGMPYQKPETLIEMAHTIRNAPHVEAYLKPRYYTEEADIFEQSAQAARPTADQTSASDLLAGKLTLAAKVDKQPPVSDYAQSRQLARDFHVNGTTMDDIYALSQHLGGLKNLALLADTMAQENYQTRQPSAPAP